MYEKIETDVKHKQRYTFFSRDEYAIVIKKFIDIVLRK
jgi:hypothetical protein